MDYIILSIPVFFILIGVELLISRLRKLHLYRFNDAVTNISCGVVQQITIALSKTVLIVGYVYLFRNFRLFESPDTWWTLVLLFIGIDFCYYWFHRLSHEINVFWGAHIVHHQSEEYNLSVALRQSSFQGFISMIFYLPLAWIGFNPIAFVTVNAFQTLYQFWIHTKLIGKLHPVLEYVFNTPSHHRVHHGRNPKYIDRNHGGTLIVFDRLFGTFQAEEEKVIYGVTKPLQSWNPLWANVDYYADLWKTLRERMSWVDRLKLLVAYPGWMPGHLGGPREPVEVGPDTPKFDTSIPKRINYYILLQFTVTLLITTVLLFSFDRQTPFVRLLISVWILMSAVSLGGVFEAKGWALFLEFSRLIALIPLAVVLLTMAQVPGIVGVAIFSIGSSIWYVSTRRSR